VLDSAPPIVHDVLASPGRPLDSPMRAVMEPLFGHSFADVRIHTDAKAAASARAVHAHAYTVGSNIAFAGGYVPGSSAGRRLLAHELAHVVQQSSNGPIPGITQEHDADRAADRVLAGKPAQIGSTARAELQRQENPAQEEPVPSFIGNRIVAHVTDKLPLGTETRIVGAAMAGILVGAIKELTSGGKGRVFIEALRQFKPANVADVMVGYTTGALEGLVSPITGLFDLAQFGEHVQAMAANLIAGALARHSTLIDDLRELVPSAASLKKALGSALARFREHPLATISALLSAPIDLSIAAEKKAYQFGAQHGREIIDSLVEPVDPKKKPSQPAAEKPKGFFITDWIEGKVTAAHDVIIDVPWAKMGEKLGYAVGWAVINAAMLLLTEGIGNFIVECAVELGNLSKTLGVFAKAAGRIAEVVAGVGKAIARVEKVVELVTGAVLKPLEPILKPFLEPFAAFIAKLRGFLKKVLGIAEKEAATVATEAAAKGLSTAADAATHAPKPTPHPAPRVAPHEPASPHAPVGRGAMGEGGAPPTTPAHAGPRGSEPATMPHPADVTPLTDEARAAARAAMREKLPQGITNDTIEMLERNPELRDALIKNPRAARALTLCESPCIPEFASATQVASVERILADAEKRGVKVSQTELRNFLHTARNRTQLSAAIREVRDAVAKTPAGGSATYGTPFATEKQIEQALKPLEEPSAKKPSPNTKEPAVVVTPVEVKIETAVQDARNLLRRRGVKGLRPSEYGTKLHAALEEVVTTRRAASPPGWVVASERRLGELVQLRPRNANISVYKYLEENGLIERFPDLPERYLSPTSSPKLSEIQPDIFVRAPSGEKMIWDLGSEISAEHLAKTMFYAEVVGREEGGFIRVAESYWRTMSLPGPAGGR
jgi:hypothetical protein